MPCVHLEKSVAAVKAATLNKSAYQLKLA